MLKQSPTPCKHRNERQGAEDAENARKYSVLRFFRVHCASASPAFVAARYGLEGVLRYVLVPRRKGQ